jgi:conjugative transfer signal peptidase TraF
MSRRWCLFAVAAAGILLLMTSLRDGAPRLVWNASSSVPLGLYRVEPGPVRRGDLVLIRPPPRIAELAHRRGYLPKSTYLIKFLWAIPGHQVCRFGTYVLVRGVFAVRALSRDSLGRRMPVWRGCRTLRSGEFFVLAHGPQSFDSRYFGMVPATSVMGRAVLIYPASPATAGATISTILWRHMVDGADDRDDGRYSTGQDKLPPVATSKLMRTHESR